MGGRRALPVGRIGGVYQRGGQWLAVIALIAVDGGCGVGELGR
jgi:hypothetical protein